MFEKFFDDLAHLPKQKFNARYTSPVLLCLLAMLLLGQLIFICMPLNQNNKASGTIVDLKIGILSYSHARFSNHSTPNYGLLITLDNDVTYDIQEQSVIDKLAASLKAKDYVVIYYPTTALKVLSAGLARDVSQVQRGDQVLYSWQGQQNEEWFIVGFLIAAMGLFYGLMRHFR